MKNKIITYIVSFMISLSIILTLNIGFLNQDSQDYIEYFIFDFEFNTLFFVLVLVFSIIIYIILRFILKIIYKLYIKDSKKLWSKKIIFIISLISIFISGLIFLLTYYPGTCMVDSLQLLLDPKGYSFQYPLLYSLFFSKLFNLFTYIFNSMDVSLFIL